MTATLNGKGKSYASSRIGAGAVDKNGSWSFSADDGNKWLGTNGDDWTNYGKHFLGVDASASPNTKDHYKYPFAKGETVYRSALTAIRQRAGQQGDQAVFDAAGSLLDTIDGKALVGIDLRALMAFIQKVKPGKGEHQDDFLSRCIPAVINDGTAKDQSQAAAICYSLWEDSKKQMAPCPMPGMSSMVGPGMGPDGEDMPGMPDMPMPEPGEAQSDYMDRCGSHMQDEEGMAPADATAMCSIMWAHHNPAGAALPANAMTTKDAKTINRAYSVMEVRQLKEDQRIIRGVATTPEPDRLGDIVEPMGIDFRNPTPLLWQHFSDEPVGVVTFDKPTKDGMTFEAQLPKVEEPGKLKDRIDEAWQSIKLGLVRGVSIGFRSLEAAMMKDGGIRFMKSEVVELSLVTIPANMSASIQVIKSLDANARAASGQSRKSGSMGAASGQTSPPGVTGSPKQLPRPQEAGTMKTVQEQITAFQNSRAAKAARMAAIMQKAADAGETLDQAESEEYDTLEAEIERVDQHLKRLDRLEKANKSGAVAVNGNGSDDAAASRGNGSGNGIRHPVVSVKANVPAGTSFTRYAMAVAASKGNSFEALRYAKAQKPWHDQTPEVELCLEHDIAEIMRASQPSGATTDGVFAGPLIAYQVMASEFIELLRPATIIGRIPGLRQVPFNIQMPRTTSGTSMGWVGEGAPKPVTGMGFETVQLRWAKAAGIVILTQELVRFSNPSAEAVVRADLIMAMAQFLDRQFVDPTVAAVTNVSPASITNGVTPVTASGITAAAFFTDLRAMFSNYFAANMSTAGGVFIMTQTQALALSLIQNTLGQQVFPTITATGGTLQGYPVIASENIPATGNSPVDGFPLIFAVPQEIMLADDGQVVIDASNQASVQTDTTPDSPPTSSTNMISLWQLNMVGLRAERWINWLKRRTAAVQYIQNAKYTG